MLQAGTRAPSQKYFKNAAGDLNAANVCQTLQV